MSWKLPLPSMVKIYIINQIEFSMTTFSLKSHIVTKHLGSKSLIWKFVTLGTITGF